MRNLFLIWLAAWKTGAPLFDRRVRRTPIPARGLLGPELFAVWVLLVASGIAGQARETEDIVLITVDGLRWQEVFTGADPLLINDRHGGVWNTNRLQQAFWRESPEERRRALLPFFWNVIAKEGQLYGNHAKGSTVRVTNGRNFTYPGFNEILAGFADDRINKNEKRNNPNVTVLEWLHQKPAFTNRVAAFANWDVFPYILNQTRSGIPVWTGYEAGTPEKGSIEEIFQQITPLWADMNFDVFFFLAARRHLETQKSRVIWIAFSETDEWAHEGRYDHYLFAAHRMDQYVGLLWQTAQSLPQYRGKTTFILTSDHGRGSGTSEWKNHGAAVAGAEFIWLAVLGPDTPPLGERGQGAAAAQNQIAATLAALLGFDYPKDVRQAGAPITDLLPSTSK